MTTTVKKLYQGKPAEVNQNAYVANGKTIVKNISLCNTLDTAGSHITLYVAPEGTNPTEEHALLYRYAVKEHSTDVIDTNLVLEKGERIVMSQRHATAISVRISGVGVE